MKYEYDAANRLRVVKKDDVNQTEVQTFQYGSSNARLMALDHSTNQWTIYAAEGGSVMAEYTEFTANTPTWTKSYTYLGDSQLSTITPNGTGGEHTEYNHPDRLGTRTITAQNGGVSYEQAHLPFGTALNAESTTANNKRFTSYDRSPKTGLDYAVNRTYDSKLGRFSQVDPIGMGDASLVNPQSFNLYSYCHNDPVNYVDPSGLGFFSFLKKLFKWVAKAITVIVAVVAVLAAIYITAGAMGMVFTSGFAATASGIGASTGAIGAITAILGAAASVFNSFRSVSRYFENGGTCPPDCSNEITLQNETVTIAAAGAGGLIKILAKALGAIGRWFARNGPAIWNWMKATARAAWEGVKSAGRWTRRKSEEAWDWIKKKFNKTETPDPENPAKEWLGPDSKVITNPAGDKVFLSKDGTRRVRFDINNPSPHKNPHMHAEELIDGKWVKSGPIYPQGVPPR